MKKIKVPIVLILSFCMFLVMNFNLSQVKIVKAVEYHSCNDGGTTPVRVDVRIHGATTTECFHYESYWRTYCQYPGCGRIVDNVFDSTYTPAHIRQLRFMFCDGTYLHFEDKCSYCGFLLGTQTSICYNHPGGHPLY